MADKDNENIEATTNENVDANEAVSDESSSAEAPAESQILLHLLKIYHLKRLQNPKFP